VGYSGSHPVVFDTPTGRFSARIEYDTPRLAWRRSGRAPLSGAHSNSQESAGMSMTMPGAGTNTLRIAVDIGRTITDSAAFRESTSQLLLGKWSSTPRDLVEGILRAIAESGGDLARANVVLHGSTVVINAILERKGAPTALITTRGFRDVYEIGRINRPE